MAHKCEFILFVSGMSVKSVRAIENMNAIGEEYFKDNFDLKIIDIAVDKEAVTRYGIFAIPTLMKLCPSPVRTIVGDLSDKQKVLKILDLEMK
jgi:circadian clock protein KaiB